MDKETRQLLRKSYSNNQVLCEVNEKMRSNRETIADLTALLNMRDAKEVWELTVNNMIVASGVVAGVSKYAFNMSKGDAWMLFATLGAGSVVVGYTKCKEELARQKRLRELIHLNKNVSDSEDYNKNQLEILKMEQMALTLVKETVTAREREINNSLTQKTKKLQKNK